MSVNLGKFPLTAGVIFMENVGGTGLGGVILGNESGLTCQVTLPGANIQRTLFAGTVDFFEVPKNLSWSGNLSVMPTATLTNSGNYPGSYLHIDIIGPDESIRGIYPMALPRLNNIGNVVNFGMAATSITNDGNTAGTNIVEATVGGDSSSAVSLLNSGHLTLGSVNNNAVVQLIGAIGNFLFASSGAVTIDNRLNCNLIIAEASNDLTLQAGSGNKVTIVVNGVNILNATSGGVIIPGGQIGKASAADLLDAAGSDTFLKATNHIYFQVANGHTVMSIDANGNMKLLGSLTQNTTP